MAGSDLAKYPFLNEAGEYLRESSFGWEELDRPDMKYIIDRAAERIEMEVDGKIYDNLERYEIERRSVFTKIFEDLFKLKIVISEDRRLFKVRVVDYLARASHFHEQEWKLINRLVHNGYVYLDADETVRLIRNELSVLIYDKVKAMSLPTLPQGIKSKADQLRLKLLSRYERRGSAAVTEYPPCIKHALEVMNKGDNLPHSARVMLATYMLAIGK